MRDMSLGKAACLSAVVTAALAACCGGGAALGAADRPHIIMFLSDDHGQAFCGCYGDKIVQTPNLDALARKGMRLTRVFAASPTCVPSRSSLYTGLYPARHGAMGNHTQCKPDVKSLPAYLKALGYRVVVANKLDAYPPQAFDFERLKATLPTDQKFRRYRAEGLDVKAVDAFLAEHARTRAEEPLCLVLGESSPHVVWETNKTYDPAALTPPPYMVDTPKTRTGLANYYQDITTMDRRLGEVLDALKRNGFDANMVFFYATDQGPEWPHCKWTVYDTGLRVPLIAVWRGHIAENAVCDAMASLVDVMPTFVDLAGGQAPEGIDGRSFKDVLLGKAKTFRDEIYASHTGDGKMNQFPQRCVRDARYKYVLNLHPERTWTTHFTKVTDIPDSHGDIWNSWVEKTKTDPQAAKLVDLIEHHPAEELYDCQADPYELHNLAGDPKMQPTLEKLRAKCSQWMAAQGDPGDKD